MARSSASEVERDRALPPVRVHEVGRRAAAARPDLAQDVADRRSFDLHDVGALLREHHRRERPRQVHGEIEDADPGERSARRLRSSPHPIPHASLRGRLDARAGTRARTLRGQPRDREDTVATTDEDAMLETLEGWLASEVVPHVMELEHADQYPHEMVEQMREFGLFAATIPEEYGGLGLSASTLRAHRRGDLAGVDVAHRRDQHPPDGGRARPPLRHRRPACATSSRGSPPPSCAAGWRSPNPTAAPTSRRCAPPRRAPTVSTCSAAPRCGSPTRTRATASRCS